MKKKKSDWNTGKKYITTKLCRAIMKNNNLNPADIEIIRNLFLSAAEQMRRTLVRTAFNAVIINSLNKIPRFT